MSAGYWASSDVFRRFAPRDRCHVCDLVRVIDVAPVLDVACGLVDDVVTGSDEKEVGIAVFEVFAGSVQEVEPFVVFVAVVGDRMGAVRAVREPIRLVTGPDDDARLFEGDSLHLVAQPAAAKARAAAKTRPAASSTGPSRSKVAGTASSRYGFMPSSQAWTTAGEFHSASTAATW